MNKVLSIFLDAGLLVMPCVNCDRKEAIQFVRTILQINTIFKNPLLSLCKSNRTVKVLMNEGLYPLRHQLEELFKVHNLETANVNTISTIINQLLQKIPTFEEKFLVEDVLYENLEITPKIIQPITFNHIKNDLERCIVLIAILRKVCPEIVGEILIMLKRAEVKEVGVSAEICLLEHTRNDLNELSELPVLFDGHVLVGQNLKELLLHVNESTVMMRAANDIESELSIRIALYRDALNKGEDPKWSEVPNFRLSSKFRDSCISVCKNQPATFPKKVFRSAINAIIRDFSDEPHEVLTRRGGSEVKRNGDKLMRRDIDNEFHLHYWDCSDGVIELEVIGPHNANLPKG